MSMNKLTIGDLEPAGKTVFVRVDFNVPLAGGAVTDDTRISAALPTIRHLAERGARVVLASHLGRPKGRVVDDLKMDPVAARLGELLGKPVRKLDDCIGAGVEKALAEMAPGDVALLENLRFHIEETSDDERFARSLAALAGIYVNDAFGTAHRAHASTHGIAEFIETRAAGFLMGREIEYFSKVLDHPARPFVTILGGAKVSDKIGTIDNLMELSDKFLIGGGMAYTFWPPYPAEQEYLTVNRSGRDNFTDPYCVCHNLYAWGYGEIVDLCVEKYGLSGYGNGSPAGQIAHRDLPAVTATSKALIHLKVVDCPGWALYEALLAGCPVITGRTLNSRMLAYDLLEDGETCLEFGVPASHDYGRGDVELDQCLTDIGEALERLSNPDENYRIGQNGRQRLINLMWNVKRDGADFNEFMTRWFG